MLPGANDSAPLWMRFRWHSAVVYSIPFLLLSAAKSDARTWYVKPDGSGDAPTIQAAVDSAMSGDVVLLASGTYTQGGTFWNLIEMKRGVTLRGEAGPEQTVLDGERRRRVIQCMSASDVRIEGVTIANGATITPDYGGGIWSTGDTRITITNCIVRDCRAAERGGGVYCENGIIENSQILNNRAGLNLGFGGGIYCLNTEISGCLIRENSVIGDGSAGGGGVVATGSGSISDCWVEGNSAAAGFGADGGGIEAGFIPVRNCVFLNNAVGAAASGRALGGGLAAADEVSDCLFIGNHASAPEGGQGGAVFGGWETFRMRRCTIVGNSASGGMDPVGGVFVVAGGTVETTILAWNNGLPSDGIGTVSCSDLFGNSLGDAVGAIDGGGNFSVDPEFCATDPVTSLNFVLQEDSPCAPGRHPDGIACGTIGTQQVGCGTVLIEHRTWGEIKSMYR